MSSIDDELDQPDKLFLLLLGVNGGSAVPGDLWLQKELFLIAKNIPELEDYLDFQPHYQGPYSEEVEDTLDILKTYGLVDTNYKKEIYLTEEGEKLFENILEEVPDDIVEMVKDMKKFVNDLTKDELLVYIYYTYGMTEKSKVIDDIEEKREEVAKKLYDKRKVTKEKAAELAGEPLEEFQNDQVA